MADSCELCAKVDLLGQYVKQLQCSLRMGVSIADGRFCVLSGCSLLLCVARAFGEGLRIHNLVTEEGDAVGVLQGVEEDGADPRPREDLHEDSQPEHAPRLVSSPHHSPHLTSSPISHASQESTRSRARALLLRS